MPSESPQSIDLIKSLVESFRARLPELRGENITEAQIRLEFLDRFWESLGWDVRNEARKSEAEKDVVIEAHVGTIEGGRTRSRRSDYLFRIDGFPRFFVEAKKPTVGEAIDKDAVFQAKSYAWNAKIPFAIATNFEVFRLFDATLKPHYDEPERGRVAEFDLRYEDYVAQWDVLYDTFSRDAVATGSLERLLAKIKKVRAGRAIRGFDRMLFDLRGSEPVDRVFLAHLEDYRLRFARDLYQQNRSAFPDADTRHGAARLTEAAGRLIDRLIFIRVCEDRDILPYGSLREAVEEAISNRQDLYSLINRRFREFDKFYNGYLFKAHFTEQLSVSDELLAEFLRSLYPPEAAYRFEVIGDDLLGIVYEQFLGSVISLRRGQVVQEQKLEVRHAGGVYYTPRFVVDTIIRRVVGPKIKGRSPIECLDVKILDPACGSGSFLIAAFQHLIDHCVGYMTANPAAAQVPAAKGARKKKRRIAFQDKQEQWHLTPDFKTDILTSCLHGVDIDPQAVEVTIMSLYMKTMEGEIPREMLKLRMLPDLVNNIHCGNSLISQADFDNYWDQKYGSLFGGDEDARFRINAFDWKSHTRGFGRLLEERDGFDCIIGNPPYIRVQELKKWAPEECEFYKWKYKSAEKGNYDIYVTFLERGLELLAPDGLLGFICPHKFWQATYGKGIRKLITEDRHLRSIIDFTDQQVFRGATTYTAIHVLSKQPNRGKVDYARVEELIDGEAQCRAIDQGPAHGVNGIMGWKAPHPLAEDPIFRFPPSRAVVVDVDERNGIVQLEKLAALSQGFKTGADAVFVVEKVRTDGEYVIVKSQATGDTHRVEKMLLKPLIKSEHMRRYEIRPTSLMLLFPYVVKGDYWRIMTPTELATDYPRAWKDYLRPLRETLEGRERGRFAGDLFYQYSRQQNFIPLSKPKLITPDIADKARFCFDENGSCVFSGGGAGGNAIIPNQSLTPEFLLGVLNSQLIEQQIRLNGTVFRGGWLNCEIRFLRHLPIKLPQSDPERRLADRISQRVRRMIEAKKRLQKSALSTRERERIERQIEADETGIDQLVRDLYGVGELPS